MKVIVSASITWKAVTGTFFVREKALKINGNLYLEHLQNEMTTSHEELIPNDDFIFIQYSAPSYRIRKVQNFLEETKFKN